MDGSQQQHSKNAPYSAASRRTYSEYSKPSSTKSSESSLTVHPVSLLQESSLTVHPESNLTARPKSSSTKRSESSLTVHPESNLIVRPKLSSRKHLESNLTEHPESSLTVHPMYEKVSDVIESLANYNDVLRNGYMPEDVDTGANYQTRLKAMCSNSISVVGTVIQKLKNVKENLGQKKHTPCYDTCGKRGLLCIVQHQQTDWKKGNAKDNAMLKELFEVTLGFEVREYNSYSKLDTELKKMTDLTKENYYCLLICISGHGGEKGVQIDTYITEEAPGVIYKTSIYKSIGEIKERFSNKTIQTLTGVPKVIILDTCRGGEYNKTVLYKDISKSSKSTKSAKKSALLLPTTDSDCLIIHATTHEHKAFIPHDEGSVGIQSVVKALQKNWMNDHLEEMLIDARREVAEWRHKENKCLRQTLETESTLTKRLMFVESSKKKKVVT